MVWGASWLLVMVALAGAVLATPPDRDPRPGEWGYRPPDGATVPVNPPSLTWVHDPQAAAYIVQWSSTPDFRNPVTVEGVRWCVYTHHEPLKPGTYFWRYRVVLRDGKVSEWSKVRRFTVPRTAVVFPKPPLDELKRIIPKEHPRLFVRADELERWRQWAHTERRAFLQWWLGTAEKVLQTAPACEPKVRVALRDPQTCSPWWPGRVITVQACTAA